MKEYQFTSDAYRMFSALNRLRQGPTSWFNAGPTQKFILRQIKAMDYTLVDADKKAKYFSERAAYTAQDEIGQPIINDDMDVAMLMMYAFILYSGTSYVYALSMSVNLYMQPFWLTCGQITSIEPMLLIQ
jgi:general transcription factor 3C polypeptide 3 (transcription factor C subunit 4)